MVPSITTILHRFTGEWAMLLQPDAILALCSEIGDPAWRDRVLTPVTTVHLFLLQILHGHTACSHLPHLSGLRFSAAAYGQARAKLPLRFFDLLLERFGSAVQRSALDEGRWHGHRTFLVDGSGCSMPDTPALQAAFGQPTEQRPGCGFPVGRLLGLFHAGAGVLLKLVVAPLLTHDLAQVQAVHPSLHEGDVLVADRGLCSYAHLALLVQAGVHQVETSLAHLKTTMQMDVLHGKTVSGVLKELTVFAIVDNLVRMVMGHSAILQHIGVERISSLDALRWLSAPSTGIPLGASIVNRIRPHRVEPRVKKRRPKSFPLMLKPRQELRQQLVQQELTG